MKPSKPFVVSATDLSSVRGLIHRLTMVRDAAGGSGITVWSNASRSAVVYWDWCLTAESVLVLSNPLGISSNLRFRDGDAVVSPDRHRLILMELVNSTCWQPQVMAHTCRLGLDFPLAA